MKRILGTALKGNLKLEEKTLSDGSHIYNVLVGGLSVPCNSWTAAVVLFTQAVKLFEPTDFNGIIGKRDY